MEFQKLDKRIVSAWRITRGILLASLLVGFAGIYIWIRRFEFFHDFSYLYYGAVCLVLVLATLNLLVYPPLEYIQWKYYIDEEKVVIKEGLFWLKTTVVPVIRIQHLSTECGPVNRKMGLVKLRIHTTSVPFTINGLTEEVAEQIAASLNIKLYARIEANELEEQ